MLPDPGGFYQLFHERRLEVARGLLKNDRSMALDVGCGYGFLRSISMINIIGMDVHATGAVTVQASAENLPFRDQVFELVFAGEVLEHLDTPAQALDEWVECCAMAGGWASPLRMDVLSDWKETVRSTSTLSPQGISREPWLDAGSTR